MTTGLISHSWELFNPVFLTGPIFDKELRVSGRRRRNYLLRFGYVMLFGFYLLSVWYSYVGAGGATSAVYRASRWSQVGEYIITSMLWFQFIAAQLIAMVMLSSSISDEIRSGTLSVLMTTPISSFQIVTGKLLSKLLQLFLLLGISLPLLAITRVFGGVPWNYVLAGICITLTAAVFAGALSLLLSTRCRYAYTVILVTILVYMLVFVAIPGVYIFLAVNVSLYSQQGTNSVFALINPFWEMLALTLVLRSSGSVPGFFSWPLHCLIMLGASALLLAVAVWRVKKAALSETFDRSGKISEANGPVKRLKGSPIIWKEMRKGFCGHDKTDFAIVVVLIGISILAIVFSFSQNTSYLSFYLMIGIYITAMIRLSILTAGSIAGEKEAQTWSVLLMTPLEDRDIIRDKIVAAIRRNIPLLILYPVLFCAIVIIANVAAGRFRIREIFVSINLILFNLLNSILLVTGCGSYFGVRLKNATEAVVATIISYMILVFLFSRVSLDVIINSGGIWGSLVRQVIEKMIIGVIGVLLAWCAVRRLRRDVF